MCVPVKDGIIIQDNEKLVKEQRMNKNLIRIIGYALQFIVLIVGIGIVFANPDMTQTRLFLTFWPLYTVGVGLFSVGYLMVELNKK